LKTRNYGQLIRARFVKAEEVFMRFPALLAATVERNKSGAPASETDTTPGRLQLINVTPLSLLLRALA